MLSSVLSGNENNIAFSCTLKATLILITTLLNILISLGLMFIQKATKALKKLLIKSVALSNPLPTEKFTNLYKPPYFGMTFISHPQIAISNALTIIPDYC